GPPRRRRIPRGRRAALVHADRAEGGPLVDPRRVLRPGPVAAATERTAAARMPVRGGRVLPTDRGRCPGRNGLRSGAPRTREGIRRGVVGLRGGNPKTQIWLKNAKRVAACDRMRAAG